MTSFSQYLIFTLFLLTIPNLTQAQELCQIDDDCMEFNSCIESKCVHKDLFPMSLFPEAAIILLITLLGGLLNSGGSGGGALLTSALIIGLNYNTKDALALVYGLLFGGNLGNFVNVATRRDPKTGKPVINYDLVLICMPPMLFGASIGVLLSRSVAPIIVLVGTVAVIAYPAKKILIKAKKLHKEETMRITKAKESEEANQNNEVKEQNEKIEDFEDVVDNQSEFQEMELIKYETALELSSPQIQSPDQQSQERSSEGYPSELQSPEPIAMKLYKMERSLFPMRKIFIILVLITAMMLLALLRGTKHVPSVVGLPYCSSSYWGLFGVGLIICLAILIVSKRFLEYIENLKRRHNVHIKDSYELSPSQMSNLSMLSLFTGILAGLLGIGGGMLLSPTMLSMGIPPQVITATAGLFVVQTSVVSLFQSALYGDVPFWNQMFFVGTSFVGSYLVSVFLSWIMDKYKRESILLYFLLAIRMVCIVIVPAFELWRHYGDYKSMLQFSSLCG